MMQRSLILMSLYFVFPHALCAVCQETDEFGNVSYVDCAQAETEDAMPVDIQPTNTLNPNEYIPKAVSDLKSGTHSSAGKKKKAHAAKQKELKSAIEALAEARKVREGDRQKTVSGSKLTEQYLQRVKSAEERVEKAKEALK